VTALEIPDEVVRMNLSANGAAGRAWLGSLPGLVLEPTHVRAWALVRSVDDALWGLSTGGTDVEWDVRCARLLAERL
jgi:hypothetical protein